jgi:hypothetical protein
VGDNWCVRMGPFFFLLFFFWAAQMSIFWFLWNGVLGGSFYLLIGVKLREM